MVDAQDALLSFMVQPPGCPYRRSGHDAALIILPAYIGQLSNHFLYGARSFPQGSREARDEERLNQHFGENMQMVPLVPKGQWVTEEIIEDLLALPEMKSVVGYVTQVGTGIPPDLLPDRIISAPSQTTTAA